MSSEEHVAELSSISLQGPRKKYRVDSRLLVKCFYILFTRATFFIGLSVITRHLWSTLVHINSETKVLLSNPNRKLYQNQTLDQVTDRSLVVQPLIGEDQYFDIGVTIWARASVEEEREWLKNMGKNVSEIGGRRDSALMDGPVQLNSFGAKSIWSELLYTNSSELQPFTTTTVDALFKIIHSDVAFRQVRLSDASSTTINFSISAEYHRDWKESWGMGRDGLKAAFTILPTSPSPLDNLKTYSSWIHKSAITPKRARPFPLGSEGKDRDSLRDEAMDLLSFVMPLVQLFQTPHPCWNDSDSFPSIFKYSSFTQVPYVISRTHIQIVKELKVMNFDSFNKSHHILKSAECGKSLKLSEIEEHHKRPNLWHSSADSLKWVTSCHRDYHSTGNLETLFELGIPLDDGSNRTEWAYAPYLEASEYGLGPKDFSPVPMIPICNSSLDKPFPPNPFLDPLDFNISDSNLDIIWLITYSGISLSKRTMFDSMNSLIVPQNSDSTPDSESNYKQIMVQDEIDQRNSIFGLHRESSTHPRRRLLLNVLSKSLLVISGAFDALYWYTRSTSAFISVPGTLLLVVASLVNCEFIIQGRSAWSALQYLLPPSNEMSIFDTIRSGGARSRRLQSLIHIIRFLMVAFIPLQAIWMSMVALRIELAWPSGSEDTLLRRIIPTIRRLRPNRQERSSERLEKFTMRWRSRLAMIASLFIAYHFMLPRIPNIAAQLHPDPDSSVLEAKMLYRDLIMKQSIVDPLFVSGKVCQLVLNSSSGFFAGSYRISAMIKVIALTLDTLHFVSWVVGQPESRGGMDAAFVIYMALMIIEGWQAASLPRAANDVDDDED
ncbi:hypothetical protein BDP27DRAFT_1447502 [Rhodocollybia butyracea]|uniref:Uncharacterized protein n=1 Tax=Rhodocollybia butyracea TaxID=206335 RepID=A0A9P5PUY0_9AGAR|nr:hypothetical protein BDP27DRAFT_1447502 [Rhodocollybia butyracea]